VREDPGEPPFEGPKSQRAAGALLHAIRHQFHNFYNAYKRPPPRYLQEGTQT
jgi:hypothetical protein